MAKPASSIRPSVLSVAMKHQKLLWSLLTILVGVIFTYVVYKGNASRVLDMMKASPEDIKAAMFGDEPYLFYCASKSSKDDQLPPLLVDLHNARHSMMKFAKIDCYKIGSSGKNIYDRFQLDKKVKPVLFGTAPWFSGVKQLPAAALKDGQKLIKYVDNTLGPRCVSVTSTKELNKYCGFTENNKVTDVLSITDTCIAFVKGTKYNSNKLKKLEEVLIRETPRGVRFVSVDYVSKVLSFDTSMENDDFDIKILAIRNGTHYLRMSDNSPATRDYFSTFITTAASTPLKGYTNNRNLITVEKVGRMKKTPQENPKKAKKSSTSSKKGSDTSSNKESRPGESTDAKGEDQKAKYAAEDVEETEKVNREREKARREEMDRQAREHFISEKDEGVDIDAHEYDREEEEVIEL